MKNLVYTLFLGCILTAVSCSNGSTAEKATVNDAAVVNAAESTDAMVAVNTAESRVNWKGTKPGGAHNGFVSLKEGSLDVKNGDVVGGKFVLDMNTITCEDLEGDYKAGLEGHLKGTGDDNKDDFFNVTDFPTASYEITKIAKLANDADATHLVYGNLTIKGVTKEVGFKAAISNDGGKISVTSPDFAINRTDFGIKFMSKNFFDNLKDKFIDDEMTMSIKLIAG